LGERCDWPPLAEDYRFATLAEHFGFATLAEHFGFAALGANITAGPSLARTLRLGRLWREHYGWAVFG